MNITVNKKKIYIAHCPLMRPKMLVQCMRHLYLCTTSLIHYFKYVLSKQTFWIAENHWTRMATLTQQHVSIQFPEIVFDILNNALEYKTPQSVYIMLIYFWQTSFKILCSIWISLYLLILTSFASHINMVILLVFRYMYSNTPTHCTLGHIIHKYGL